jgi:hypothetical protein
MSRSRKSQPVAVCANCRGSRRDKRLWHRRYRRAADRALRAGAETAADMPRVEEIWDAWFGPQDYRYEVPPWELAEWERPWRAWMK